MTRETTITRPISAIADEINHHHAECERAVMSAIGHARRAGELLIEAKSQISHGEWLPWLRANFVGSERTAQAYMRVARELPKSADSADMTLDGALKQLAAPKDGEDETDPPQEPPQEWQDWFLAALFGIERPVPERFHRATDLLVKAGEKRAHLEGRTWITPPPDFMPGEDETMRELRWLAPRDGRSVDSGRAMRAAHQLHAEAILLEAEAEDLVPELMDSAWSKAAAKRAETLVHEIKKRIAELEAQA